MSDGHDDRVEAGGSAARVGGDSPKPHGDKLGVAGATAPDTPATGPSGDSPKPHGDKLEQAVKEAAKG